MKRIFLFIATMSATALAFTDLTATPDTAVAGDTIFVSGVYSQVGGSATVLSFIDLNGNLRYDASADLLNIGPEDEVELVDGEWSTDVLVDGVMKGELYTSEEPWCIVGTHVNILTDAGGSDTGIIVIRMDTTEVFISGTVLANEEPLAGVGVSLACYNTMDQLSYQVEVLTDNQGEYLIYIPDEIAGTEGEIEFFAIDRLKNAAHQGLIAPDCLYLNPADLNSSLTGEDMVFTNAPYIILGTVVNENGDIVSDFDLTINGENVTDLFITSDNEGTFTVPANEGLWEISANPDKKMEYLLTDQEFEVDGTHDTVEITVNVHTTDATISGMIIDTFDLEIDFSRVLLEVFVLDDPEWCCIVFAEDDGSFSVNVSSQLGPYFIWIDNKGPMPDNYTLPFYYSEDGISAGADNVEIYVIPEEESIRRTDRYGYTGQITLVHTSQDISFALLSSSRSGLACIRLFGTDGRIVGTLYEGKIVAGINSLTLQHSVIANGLYVAVIDFFTSSERFTLVKNVVVRR